MLAMLRELLEGARFRQGSSLQLRGDCISIKLNLIDRTAAATFS